MSTIKERLALYQEQCRKRKELKRQAATPMDATMDDIKIQLTSKSKDKTHKTSASVGRLSKDAIFDKFEASSSALGKGSSHSTPPLKYSRRFSTSVLQIEPDEEEEAKETLDAMLEVVDGKKKYDFAAQKKDMLEFAIVRERYVSAVEQLMPSKFIRKVDIDKTIKEESIKQHAYQDLRKAWDEYEQKARTRPKVPSDDEKNILARLALTEDKVDKAWIGFAEQVVENVDEKSEEYVVWKAQAKRMRKDSTTRRKFKVKEEKKREEQYWKQEAERLQRELDKADDLSEYDDKSDSEEESELAKSPSNAPDTMAPTAGLVSSVQQKLKTKFQTTSIKTAGLAKAAVPKDKKTIQLVAKEDLGKILAQVDGGNAIVRDFSSVQSRYVDAIAKLEPKPIPSNLRGKAKTNALLSEQRKKDTYCTLKQEWDKYEASAEDKPSTKNQSEHDKKTQRKLVKAEEFIDKTWVDFARTVIEAAEEDEDPDSEYEDEINKWKDEAARLLAQSLARKRRKGKRVTREDKQELKALGGSNELIDEVEEDLYGSVSNLRPGMMDWGDGVTYLDTPNNRETNQGGGAIEGYTLKDVLGSILASVDGGNSSIADFSIASNRYSAAITKLEPMALPVGLKGKEKKKALVDQQQKKETYINLKRAWDEYESDAADKPALSKHSLPEIAKMIHAEEKADQAWVDFAKNVVAEATSDDDASDSEYEDEIAKWRDEAARLKAQALARKRRKGRVVSEDDTRVLKDLGGDAEMIDEEEEYIYRRAKSPYHVVDGKRKSKVNVDELNDESEKSKVRASSVKERLKVFGSKPPSATGDAVSKPVSFKKWVHPNAFASATLEMRNEVEKCTRNDLGNILSVVDGGSTDLSNFSSVRSRYIEAVAKLEPLSIPENISEKAKTSAISKELKKSDTYSSLKHAWDKYEVSAQDKPSTKNLSEDDNEINRLILKAEERTDKAWVAFAKRLSDNSEIDGVAGVINDRDIINRYNQAARLSAQALARKRRKGKRITWEDKQELRTLGGSNELIDDVEEELYGSVSNLRPGRMMDWGDGVIYLDDSDNHETNQGVGAAEGETAKDVLGSILAAVDGGESSTDDFSTASSRYCAAIAKLEPTAVPVGLRGKFRKKHLMLEREKKERYVIIKRAWNKYDVIAADKPAPSKHPLSEVAKVIHAEDKSDQAWVDFARDIVAQATSGDEGSKFENYDEIAKWRTYAAIIKAQALARKRRNGGFVSNDDMQELKVLGGDAEMIDNEETFIYGGIRGLDLGLLPNEKKGIRGLDLGLLPNENVGGDTTMNDGIRFLPKHSAGSMSHGRSPAKNVAPANKVHDGKVHEAIANDNRDSSDSEYDSEVNKRKEEARKLKVNAAARKNYGDVNPPLLANKSPEVDQAYDNSSSTSIAKKIESNSYSESDTDDLPGKSLANKIESESEADSDSESDAKSSDDDDSSDDEKSKKAKKKHKKKKVSVVLTTNDYS
jgi:hypothetical protein